MDNVSRCPKVPWSWKTTQTCIISGILFFQKKPVTFFTFKNLCDNGDKHYLRSFPRTSKNPTSGQMSGLNGPSKTCLWRATRWSFSSYAGWKALPSFSFGGRKGKKNIYIILINCPSKVQNSSPKSWNRRVIFQYSLQISLLIMHLKSTNYQVE